MLGAHWLLLMADRRRVGWIGKIGWGDGGGKGMGPLCRVPHESNTSKARVLFCSFGAAVR